MSDTPEETGEGEPIEPGTINPVDPNFVAPDPEAEEVAAADDE